MAKTLTVRRVGMPGTMDGNLSISDFINLLDDAGITFESISCDTWRNSDRNPEVRLRIAHFSDGIILHFHVIDNELRAVESTDDGRVWEDSCCEFFVSPDKDDFYYNFECNCIGTLLLHGGREGEERPSAPKAVYDGIRRLSSLGKTAFGKVDGACEWDLVEVIPAGAFFRHSLGRLDGLEMTANFYKCGDLLNHPHFLSWAPIELEKPQFHCPQFFGRLIFE